ncbi:MAG: hypothetical protein WD404_03025 [Solirubrobacterales bacterium]
MQLLDDQLILSASDLNNHLACAHLTTLDLARARGELEVELERGADAELLARKGDEYEDRYLVHMREIPDICTKYSASMGTSSSTISLTSLALGIGLRQRFRGQGGT